MKGDLKASKNAYANRQPSTGTAIDKIHPNYSGFAGTMSPKAKAHQGMLDSLTYANRMYRNRMGFAMKRDAPTKGAADKSAIAKKAAATRRRNQGK